MMVRAITAGVLVAALGNAPLQCSKSRDPDLRREDSAGDALYALAQDFRAKGNEQAATDTLRFLVEHYPSNRHVPSAREELAATGAAPAMPSDAGK